MLDASPYVNPGTRELTKMESALIAAMLGLVPEGSSLRGQLVGARVECMDDGGMGSLRFAGPDNRKMSREVVSAHATDEDGATLELSINIDQNGELFELDIWRVDFKPLLRLPEPGELTRA